MKQFIHTGHRFLSLAVIALGLLSFNKAAAQKSNTMSSSSFDHIKQIKAGVLDIGYVEAGPATGEPIVLLHGWPYDIHSYTEVSALLAAKGYHVFVPYLRGYGATRFLDAHTPRNGQQAALAADVIEFLDA